MPSFADSIFLFVLALLLFGPKKLPVLARELGKWMGEFRRASNEFKSQMEDELRASEQADRQKQIVAMEAAAPIPPALNDPPEPEHPHLRRSATDVAAESSEPPPAVAENSILPPGAPDRYTGRDPERSQATQPFATEATDPSAQSSPTASSSAMLASADLAGAADDDGPRPIPIATSGSLNMMPPATGLPTPRSTRPNGNALSSLVESIPESNAPETESLAHGD